MFRCSTRVNGDRARVCRCMYVTHRGYAVRSVQCHLFSLAVLYLPLSLLTLSLTLCLCLFLSRSHSLGLLLPSTLFLSGCPFRLTRPRATRKRIKGSRAERCSQEGRVRGASGRSGVERKRERISNGQRDIWVDGK